MTDLPVSAEWVLAQMDKHLKDSFRRNASQVSERYDEKYLVAWELFNELAYLSGLTDGLLGMPLDEGCEILDASGPP